MRYEVVRIAQLLFALLLVGGAFAAGIFVGWARWGIRGSAVPPRPVGRVPDDYREPSVGARVAPENLFAPDLRSQPVDGFLAEELVDIREVAGVIGTPVAELDPMSPLNELDS